MIIKKYSDLEKVEDNMLVDLNELNSKQIARAISFLAGLTYKKGSLTKIARNKFWIILNNDNI